MKMWIGLAVIVSVWISADSQNLPNGDEILAKIEERTAGIQDFEVTVEADINVERVRIPRTSATMYFKKPDKVHFSSTSITLLPRDGMALSASLFRQRYNAALLGEEDIEGKKVLKLQLSAKDPGIRLRELILWVDPQLWTIGRMQTVPYEGRTLTVDFVYALVAGKHLLPASMKATFGLLGEQPAKAKQNIAPDASIPMEAMQPQIPRSGTVTITYSDYKINIGLPDEMFGKSEER